MRFFLRFQDGNLSIIDPEAFEAPDVMHAIAEARKSAQWIIKDDLRSGRVRPAAHFIVTDENGGTLATISFNDQTLN